ncbi:MAG: IS110 family transposase [Actinomycetota bacterium]|jgi:transposase|nr:IS110 family transposase [Actinomycetota bacterium]
MIVIGIDPHMKTHTAVALDIATGRKIAERTVAGDTYAVETLLSWARGLGSESYFAIEDCRHVSARLERHLLGRGQRVVRVPPKLMAGTRRSARAYGKSDGIDAECVARAALREPDLPQACLSGLERDVRLLVDHRHDLVQERTRIQERLRWNVHDLDVGLDLPLRVLDRYVWLDRLEGTLLGLPETTLRRIATEQVGRCRDLTRQIRSLKREIDVLTRKLAQELLAIPGCSTLSAACLIGQTAGVSRFSSEAAFAMHVGTAPLPVSSGKSDRHRLNRTGNRRLNSTIHMIAITQARMHPPAIAYMERKRAEGMSNREALRCLKRYISRTVYKTMVQAEKARADSVVEVDFAPDPIAAAG